MTDTKVGTVTHFYDKIKVAIVALSGNLKVGDTIRFSRAGDDLFEQKIDSIQVEHNSIDAANAGDVVGLRVENEVKEGTDVYRIE